ncbi:helix-turn-helix domain-containing protein [Streptomyces sp. 549]|uniref:PucR family transcriptional regulator n=1 Tax=Streptomyces sp. 549 TaxID=3049076 RepID=UPI0024C34751|nr:helix-turn-helix domain-containing protein [Streptomyces sp. 549]MDK1474605.1 helix-turn-helix domain-containing protein [Streptomyces sp. 549]
MQHVIRSRVRGLPAPPHAGPPRTRSLVDAEAVAVLHRAAQALLDNLPALTDRLVAALREEEPSYRSAIDRDVSDVWQEVHCSLTHNVGSLIRPRQSRDEARRTTRRIGTCRAELGVPLDAVLHAFRLGGAMVWQGLVDETTRSHPGDIPLLVHVAADVWNFVDEHCGLVADAYRETERRLAWRRENQLRLMTGALLDGTARIADLPDAAAVLGLPLHGRYAVLVVERVRDAPRPTAVPPLRLPPGLRVLWHTGPAAERAIVLLPADDEPPAAPEVLAAEAPGPDGDDEEVPVRCPAEQLAEWAALTEVPKGLRAGVSSVVTGLAALGEGRQLAETALRACPRDGGITLLDAHLPAALVVSSPGLGAALVQRVLGPLDRLDPADRELLLETLTAWLDADGSAQRAGGRLYCHRNTVLNRLRRFEQLTGRCLSRPSDAVEISLALTAQRLLTD